MVCVCVCVGGGMDVVVVVAPALKGCVWGGWLVGVGSGGVGGGGYDDAVTFALLVEDIGVWSLVVDEVDTTQVLHHNVQLVMRLKQTATGQPLS